MQARANFYLMTAAATSVVVILFPGEFQLFNLGQP